MKNSVQRWMALLWTLLCPGFAGSVQAAPAGSIIDVSGEVMLIRHAAKLKANLFDNLLAGDEILVSQGAKVVLTHNLARKEYAIINPGEFKVGMDDIRPKGGARLQTKNLSELAVVSLGNEIGKGRATVGAVRMRGAEPPVTFPLEGEVVLSLTPTLAWPALPGVEAYQLMLKKPEGDVLAEFSVEQPQYRIASANLLEWGGRYQWSVATEQGDRRILFVKSFSLVERTDLETLERMKPDKDGEFSAWIIYAKALEYLGALTEARAVWTKLLTQRPDLRVLEGLAKGK